MPGVKPVIDCGRLCKARNQKLVVVYSQLSIVIVVYYDSYVF